MLSLLRLERKQKNLFKSIWNSHISLSFLLTCNRNDKYVHTHRSSLENFKWTCKRFLHSYGSYDSTTITRGLLPTRQARKFPSPLNEMPKSTRQFAPSTRYHVDSMGQPSQHQSLQQLKSCDTVDLPFKCPNWLGFSNWCLVQNWDDSWFFNFLSCFANDEYQWDLKIVFLFMF